MNKGEESKEKKTQRTQERRPVSREERMRRKRERLKRRRRILIVMMCAALVILILIIAGIVALVRHFTGNNDSGGKDSGQASDLRSKSRRLRKKQRQNLSPSRSVRPATVRLERMNILIQAPV